MSKRVRDSQNMHSLAIQNMYASKNWFMVPRDFHFIMGIEESHVLAFLINVGHMTGTDWFKCSVNRILKEFHITRTTHDRIFKKLVEKKFIQRKMKGNPAKRFLWIDYQLLYSMVQEAIAASVVDADSDGG